MMYWVRRAIFIIMDAYEFNKRYWRGLVVRAIEDLCFTLLLVVGIWLVCTLVGGTFDALGVSF